MASTSVHFPKGLLDEIDRRAAEAGVSRNRFIVESCRAMLEQGSPNWPAGFFSNDHLTKSDLAELRQTETEFEQSIKEHRKNRAAVPF